MRFNTWQKSFGVLIDCVGRFCQVPIYTVSQVPARGLTHLSSRNGYRVIKYRHIMDDEKKVEEPIVVPAPTSPEPDPEIKKKEEQVANLNKAIEEANETLRIKRQAIKEPIANEEVPVIDMNDPAAKAWEKHINDKTAPLSSQLERQKEEVRTFALRKFLQDKPSLAGSPEKLKELMANYDRIKVATEQTQEGVLLDLDKAYGATFHEELISAARQGRLERAKEDMIASDIGISRGTDSEPERQPQKRRLSAEEQKIVEGWETFGAPKID